MAKGGNKKKTAEMLEKLNIQFPTTVNASWKSDELRGICPEIRLKLSDSGNFPPKRRHAEENLLRKTGRSYGLKKCDGSLKVEDLTKLDEYLKKSTFTEMSQLYKERNDNIREFLYFDVSINGVDVRIQVGKRVWISNKNSKLRVKYVVYCIKKK